MTQSAQQVDWLLNTDGATTAFEIARPKAVAAETTAKAVGENYSKNILVITIDWVTTY